MKPAPLPTMPHPTNVRHVAPSPPQPSAHSPNPPPPPPRHVQATAAATGGGWTPSREGTGSISRRRGAGGRRYEIFMGSSWILLGSSWDPHGIVMGSSSDPRGILMGSFRIIIPRWQATDLKGYARISASSAINSADFGSPSRAIFEICLPNITKAVRQQQEQQSQQQHNHSSSFPVATYSRLDHYLITVELRRCASESFRSPQSPAATASLYRIYIRSQRGGRSRWAEI